MLRPDGRDLLQWGDQEEQYILKENDWDSPEFLGRHKNILSFSTLQRSYAGMHIFQLVTMISFK